MLVSTVAVNEAGDTPLSLECSRGNLEMVKALINKHVDPNSKCLSVLLHCWWWSSTEPVNKAGDTLLSLACANGHLDTVKYLVNQHHCDPKSKHWYIIMYINCCITQYTRTCTGTVNKAGDTPFSLAYKGGHWEVVKYLAITHHCDTTSKVCSWLSMNDLLVLSQLLNFYLYGIAYYYWYRIYIAVS